MKSYKELVEILEHNGVERHENGVSYLYKQSPDGEEGYLDTREAVTAHADKDDILKNPQNYDQNVTDNLDKLFPEITEADAYVFAGIPIGVMRKSMGWNSIDLTSAVETEKRQIPGGDGLIDVRIYRPQHKKENRPCLIYFHGGGFMSGSPLAMENSSKDIAEKGDAVVVSVDYRLAPEHPFPAGVEDCFASVVWVYEHAGELLIDKEKIGVAGDSAGGNLAAVCALRDRNEGRNMIHYQALLYATLMRGDEEDYPGYLWKPELYSNKAGDGYINGAISWIREANDMLAVTYVQKADKRNPYISPMDAKEKEGLPKTLIALAEYDYLRVEGDYYTRQLREAGVEVRTIRYGGVCHAFLDKYGYLPQAEDCVKEIAKDLRSL